MAKAAATGTGGEAMATMAWGRRLLRPGGLASGWGLLQLPALRAPGVESQQELAAHWLWHEGLSLQDPPGDAAQTPGGTDVTGSAPGARSGPGRRPWRDGPGSRSAQWGQNPARPSPPSALGWTPESYPWGTGGLSLVQTTDLFYPLVEDLYSDGAHRLRERAEWPLHHGHYWMWQHVFATLSENAWGGARKDHTTHDQRLSGCCWGRRDCSDWWANGGIIISGVATGYVNQMNSSCLTAGLLGMCLC